MSIVGVFDVYRRQLTFEYLHTATGELKRGPNTPADRPQVRAWLARFAGQEDVQFALEGCTGWRYVAEELLAAGITPHLAEPTDSSALRGKKRHAKTDKTGLTTPKESGSGQAGGLAHNLVKVSALAS